MNTDDAQARLQDDALSLLLELGMAAARESHDRLMASEDAKALADCALAFNRVSRSVRQTIALQAKVARVRRQRDREDAADTQRQAEDRTKHRKDQVKATVGRLIWTEAEGDEAEYLIDSLDDLISERALYEGFADQPVDVCIARICADLGVSLRPPDPPPQGEAPPKATEGVSPSEDDYWRSSA